VTRGDPAAPLFPPFDTPLKGLPSGKVGDKGDQVMTGKEKQKFVINFESVKN
jgi:hypothetical protein